MGYFGGPNKALANPCFKDQNWSHLRREPVEKKEGEKKRKRRGRGDQAKIKRYGCLPSVWKLNLRMDSLRLSMNFHALMLKCLSPNLGF